MDQLSILPQIKQPQIFSQSNNGGTTTAEGIRYPSNLFYDSGGNPMSIGKMQINTNGGATHQNAATTSTIIATNLPDESQAKYAPGHPLWVYKSHESVNQQRHAIYSIFNINYWLEQTYRESMEVSIDSFYESLKNNPNDISSRAKRPRFDLPARGNDKLPLSFDEFSQSFRYLGICHSILDPPQLTIRTRTISFATRFEETLPNIWGNVSVGDVLYYKLTMTNGMYDSFYDIDGNVLGPPTNGSFPQLVPYFEKHTKKFIHCTEYMNPKPQDLDCFETVLRKQKIYEQKNGLPDFTLAPKEKLQPLVYNQYRTPPMWKVGTVLRFVGDPSNYDIKKPLRSVGDYEVLKSKCHLTVNLETITRDLEFIYAGENL